MVAAGVLSVAMILASMSAEAAQGRKKSLLIGAAGGVAAGAAGAYLINKMSNRSSEPRGVDQTATGSVTRVRQEACDVRNVQLFDKRGNYVKSERMRVCQ